VRYRKTKELIMGDIFDVTWVGDDIRTINVFSELHLDPEYIDDDHSYNQPLDGENYNERLALGSEMLGQYD